MHTHTHTDAHTHIHTDAHTHAYMHTHTHIHTHTHTHAHTETYTHTFKNSCAMFDFIRLKQYRQARSRQLQCLDAINWLTGTLLHNERSVSVTMKVMDEFRRTRGGDRLPRINAAFIGTNQSLEYKENFTQHGLPHLLRTSESRWKVSEEPNFCTAESLNVPEPKFKLPALSKEANHMFPSSRGSLRVRLSYRDQDCVIHRRKKVSLSSLVLNKDDKEVHTWYRLEKR